MSSSSFHTLGLHSSCLQSASPASLVFPLTLLCYSVLVRSFTLDGPRNCTLLWKSKCTCCDIIEDVILAMSSHVSCFKRWFPKCRPLNLKVYKGILEGRLDEGLTDAQHILDDQWYRDVPVSPLAALLACITMQMMSANFAWALVAHCMSTFEGMVPPHTSSISKQKPAQSCHKHICLQNDVALACTSTVTVCIPYHHRKLLCDIAINILGRPPNTPCLGSAWRMPR